MKILIPVKASEELPEDGRDVFVKVGDIHEVACFDNGHWDIDIESGVTNRMVDIWYKPVSKAEYDKQVLAEKIDELLPSEHWMDEKADEFQRNTGASISSTSSYLFGMGKIVDFIKTKLK
jgi:hypothetical protein